MDNLLNRGCGVLVWLFILFLAISVVVWFMA